MRFSTRAAFGAGFITSHASFFFIGRKAANYDLKQLSPKEISSARAENASHTKAVSLISSTGIAALSAMLYIIDPCVTVLAPAITLPVLSHFLSYEAGKYTRFSEAMTEADMNAASTHPQSRR